MIGGEFEIDLGTKRNGFASMPDTYYYASGRAALYQILKSLQGKQTKVWFPDYLCHTMVEAAMKAGFEYDFYALNDKFLATAESLDHKGFKDGGLVLLINYFGLQDLRETAKCIKESYPNAVIIEDDVQAYFSFAEGNNPNADYRFTSLRKTLAVPDGGLVYTKATMPQATDPNTFVFYKIEAGVMKMNRSRENIKDEDYLALFEKGSELIDENYESVMSHESEMLYAGTGIQSVKQRRRENAAFLLQGLKTLGIKPLIEVPESVVPLHIPIYLDNRNEVRKRMFQNEIYCPVHWPTEGISLNKGNEMAEHELSLIVDQRYGINDMEEILKKL